MHRPGTRHRAPLKPLDDRAVRQHPIHLGWWFLGILIVGVAAIGVWTVVQLHPGVDPVGPISVGASAVATFVVAMLGAVALINFISWARRTDYLWILPSDFADVRLDWLIAGVVIGGLIVGRLFWH